METPGRHVPRDEIGCMLVGDMRDRLQGHHAGHELHDVADMGLGERSQRPCHGQAIEWQAADTRDVLADATLLGRVPCVRQLHGKRSIAHGVHGTLTSPPEQSVEGITGLVRIHDDTGSLDAHRVLAGTWATTMVLSSRWRGVGQPRRAFINPRHRACGDSGQSS